MCVWEQGSQEMPNVIHVCSDFTATHIFFPLCLFLADYILFSQDVLDLSSYVWIIVVPCVVLASMVQRLHYIMHYGFICRDVIWASLHRNDEHYRSDVLPHTQFKMYGACLPFYTPWKENKLLIILHLPTYTKQAYHYILLYFIIITVLCLCL